MNAKKAWMRCLSSKLDRRWRRIGRRKRISERFLKMGHSVLFLDFCTMAIDNGGYFGGVVDVAAL